MDMTQSFLTGGKLQHNNNTQCRPHSRRVRVVCLGTDPKALERVNQKLSFEPRSEEGFALIEEGLRHVALGGFLGAAPTFLSIVGDKLEFHGYDSEFGLAVKEKFGKMRRRSFQEQASKLLPKLF